MVRKNFFVLLILGMLYLMPWNVFAETVDSKVLTVGYMEYDSPASYTLSGEPRGIAVDLFKATQEKLRITTRWVPYHTHEEATTALSNKHIDVLVGAFVHDQHHAQAGITETPVYFIDTDIIIAPKGTLSFADVLNMIWNDLLQNTLLFSLFAGLIFWVLLCVFEGSKHPELKEMGLAEKMSYTFFEIWACFLRDLLYRPVTNIGRVLMSLWMFLSIILITVVTSIMTSTIIVLHTGSQTHITKPQVLYQQNVGYLAGHHSTAEAILLAGGRSQPIDDIGGVVEAVAINHSIPYGVVSKTMLVDYLLAYPEVKEQLMISSVPIAYEGWVLLAQQDLSLYSAMKAALLDVIDDGRIYGICAMYVSHPEHCLVM